MGRIPEHILNEIQDRCDIVEVISSYIPLKAAGRNFKALCPFHHEKTPSFIVSPDKQIYHCFGCNSGGNVFNFIKEYEKIDFIEAVKMLAQKTGVKIPEYKKEAKADSSLVAELYNINNIATNFYHDALKNVHSSSECRRYIDKRGLEEHTIKRFMIGYAGPSWRSFTEYLLKRGIKMELALKAGLVLKAKDGGCYDLFRNRIIFPIFDARGRTVGFGARVLDDSLPKYINSPETMIYKKGKNLFGLNFATSFIRERGFAVITEGYLDVITCHQYGLNNVISSLGTALTVEQIRLLRRYTHNVVMVYDADLAGEMATLRGLDLFLEEGMHVRVATLDKGHDPDSFIRKFGPRGFDAAIKKARTLFDYKLGLLKERFDSFEPEDKAAIVNEMLSTICKVRNAVMKGEYVKRLSAELSVREDGVWDELKKLGRLERRRQQRLDKSQYEKKTISISPAERILVRLMLEDVDVISRVRDNLKPFDFKNPDVRQVVEMLFSMDTNNGYIDATRLINYLKDKVEPNIISFIVNEDIEIKDRERNITDCIKAVKREKRESQLRDIQNRLSIAQRNGYEDEARSLLEEFNRLIKEEGGVK